jgi:S-adenosylmethionine/arginine decarboxylase-like enzyme
MSSWGYHLVIDAKGCDTTLVKNCEYIQTFVSEMVEKIKMVPYGDPILAHFGPEPCNTGWTVIQLIETSSIVGHFMDESGDLYLDVFSCKEFDKNIVIEFLKKSFKPKKVKSKFIKRQA